MKTVIIQGTGSYLPPIEMSSADLAKVIGVKDGEWIKQHLGIESRRYMESIDPQTGRTARQGNELDMAEAAARQALVDAKLQSSDISGLWYVSCTQEGKEHRHFSRAAIELHYRLGLPDGSYAFEIDSGCGGVVQAIGIASDMMKGNGHKNVLVAAGNAPSLYIDRELYLKTKAWLSIYIFGEGAGALVLGSQESSESGILATFYAADGTDPLMYYHPKENIDPLSVYEIDAQAVKKYFPVYMEKAIRGLQAKHPFSLDQIDRFYFHQANKLVLLDFARQLNIPLEKVAINVDKYANLSAASLPVLIDEDFRQGNVKTGDLCLGCVVGAGVHYGAFLYRR